ncbi:MAG: DUF6775 family putative metallopeptidase [Candidatus Omnitrophota bacterium]
MKEVKFSFPERIILYIDGKVDLDFEKLRRFLRIQTKRTVLLKKIKYGKKDISVLAKRFARLRIKELTQKKSFVPLRQELEFEKNTLLKNANPSGAVYEGVKLCAVYADILKIHNLKDLHVVVTKRCIATFDEDYRYHLRAILCAHPAVISTTGIIEAPAKPRPYYLLKQQLMLLGRWDSEYPRVKKHFRRQFIDYQDKRINGAIKGYFLQVLFYHTTGAAFCRNKSCRLFNAHWQKDLIYSQLKAGRLCKKHKKMLKDMRSGSKNKR